MKALYWSENNKILKSGYTVLQTWKGLSKVWTGYKIAKRKGEHEKLKYYASGIQKLQRELIDAGIASPQSLGKFPNIDIDEK
jgi:hypothetical protein